MKILEAWNACNHGGTIRRPGGVEVEKWIGEKPGLPPSFDRWLVKNGTSLPSADLMGEDWEIDQT